MEKNVNRRSLIKIGLLTLATLPFFKKGKNSFISSALAEDGCPTKEPAGKSLARPTEGQGKVLEYVTDANTSKNALHKAGQTCANCMYYKKEKADSGYAPCIMMANKYVSSCGWCKTYKVKK